MGKIQRWLKSKTEQNQRPGCFFQENRRGSGDRFVCPLPGLPLSCSPMETVVMVRKKKKRVKGLKKHQPRLL